MTETFDFLDLSFRFGVALAIGLLIGLQREYAHGRAEDREPGNNDELFAGTRTFALLGLTGCGAAYLGALAASPWVFAVLLILIGAMLTGAYYAQAAEGQVGLTTEIAALMTVMAGALCFWEQLEVAAALGVATAVLLALKVQTRRLAANITREDVYATLTFAVISFIVLPLLPRTPVAPAPFDVLVPYRIWLMVVFISGISFLGYVLIKVVGTERGVGLTGILGGLASSTAVTLSFAQRSRDAEGLARAFALGILLAWTVMFIRVMVEVAVVNPALFGVVWLPMAAGAATSLAYSGYLYLRQNADKQEEEDRFTNPFELKPALLFGLLYAVILLVAHMAQQYLGDTGIYLSSIASGLADVDAITLSMAELSQEGGSVDRGTAARAIVLAAASNTLVKGGIVLSTGSPALRKVILPGMVLTLVAALGVAFLF